MRRFIRFWKKRNAYFHVGFVILAVLFLCVIVSYFWLPYDPTAMNPSMTGQGPSFSHIFGTDEYGRDVFSRVLVGMQDSFTIAFGVIALGGLIGAVVGSLSGYLGGWLDEVIMRLNDSLISIPSILLALVMISLVGAGKYNVIVALGIAFIPSFARLVRGEVIKVKDAEYVRSAKLMGAGKLRIIFIHIFPNIFPTWMAGVAVGFNNAVLAESGLSFLGIGVTPPEASLGRMLAEAQSVMFSSPWCVIAPGIFLILLILGFSFVSENYSEKGV